MYRCWRVAPTPTPSTLAKYFRTGSAPPTFGSGWCRNVKLNEQIWTEKWICLFHISKWRNTEWSGLILLKKFKYFICCFKQVLVKTKRFLLYCIQDTLISCPKSSWTTLYYTVKQVISTPQTKTMLGHLMSISEGDKTVTRRYYYSIKEISVGGRCAWLPDGYSQIFSMCLAFWASGLRLLYATL